MIPCVGGFKENSPLAEPRVLSFLMRRPAQVRSHLAGLLIKNETPKTAFLGSLFSLAEKEGFEPPLACAKTVFKTAAFNRSAISP